MSVRRQRCLIPVGQTGARPGFRASASGAQQHLALLQPSYLNLSGVEHLTANSSRRRPVSGFPRQAGVPGACRNAVQAVGKLSPVPGGRWPDGNEVPGFPATTTRRSVTTVRYGHREL